jgi:hypothetical protein
MPEPRSFPPSILAFAFLILGLINVGLLLRSLRKVRRRAGLAQGAWLPDDPGSPRDRLIARSREVRAALAARFGPSWRAKTTEEIAAEPVLTARLGPVPAARLVAFLAAADRSKFAGAADLVPPEPSSGFDWLDELLDALRAEDDPAAGARSRINGK